MSYAALRLVAAIAMEAEEGVATMQEAMEATVVAHGRPQRATYAIERKYFLNGMRKQKG